MGAEVSKKWFESQNDLEYESWTKFCCLVSRQVRARNSSKISQEFQNNDFNRQAWTWGEKKGWKLYEGIFFYFLFIVILLWPSLQIY